MITGASCRSCDLSVVRLARDWSLNECSCTMMTVYVSCSMAIIFGFGKWIWLLCDISGGFYLISMIREEKKTDNEFSYDLKLYNKYSSIGLWRGKKNVICFKREKTSFVLRERKKTLFVLIFPDWSSNNNTIFSKRKKQNHNAKYVTETNFLLLNPQCCCFFFFGSLEIKIKTSTPL